jgi:hypothetical protein
LLEERFPKTRAKYEPMVTKVAEFIGDKGVVSLERLTTAYLLMKRHPEFSDAQLTEELRRVKPHISDEGAIEAVVTVRAKVESLFAQAPSD